MIFLSEVKNVLTTIPKSHWVHKVLFHISQQEAMYGRKAQIYEKVSAYLDIEPLNFEVFDCGSLFLETIGNVEFAICYRDVSELDMRIQESASKLDANIKAVFVFEPTADFINAGNNTVLIYSIENKTSTKISHEPAVG